MIQQQIRTEASAETCERRTKGKVAFKGSWGEELKFVRGRKRLLEGERGKLRRPLSRFLAVKQQMP